MTVQPDLPHKVSQIRHDLDDLYELMSQVERSQIRTAGILQRHSNRFEELQQTLDLHGGRLDRIEHSQRQMQDSQRQMQDSQRQMQDGLRQMQDSQRQMQDSQRQQFDYLSVQLTEVLNALSGPAATDPAPESER